MSMIPRRFAPFAKPDREQVRPPVLLEGAADPPAEDDFPPIEQFIDEFPSIDDYLADESPVAGMTAATETPGNHQAHDEGEAWGSSGWQSYDWGSIAPLGPTSGDEMTADAAWNPQPWPEPHDYEAQTTRTVGDAVSIGAASGPSANEVAAALNDIAQRIRSGELPIDHFRTSSPEVAMAAVIATMLRLRG